MGITVSHRRAIGPSAMANARHFRVSPRFVNDMVILKRASGGLLPKPQGKLAPCSAWLRGRLAVKGDLTLDEDLDRDGRRAWPVGASRVGRQMAAPAWPQS